MIRLHEMSLPEKQLPKPTKEQENIMTSAYSEYHKALFSRAQYKISNKKTSEDLVQVTFLKTWRYLLLGGKIDTMRAFLYHILNNLIIDEYRKRKHFSVSLDKMMENGFEPFSKNNETVLNKLDGNSALLLIAQLPTKYQLVLKMRYVQSLSLEEISKITGLSKNTIAVQIHRAIKKLAVLYSSEE